MRNATTIELVRRFMNAPGIEDKSFPSFIEKACCTASEYNRIIRELIKDGKIDSDCAKWIDAGGGENIIKGHYDPNMSVYKTSDQMYSYVDTVVRAIANGTSATRHAVVYGDPGVGKSHIIFAAVKEECAKNHRHLDIASGALSASITSVVGYFAAHAEDEVLVLDDNDDIINNSAPPLVKNFLKAILDAKADETPVTTGSGPAYVSAFEDAIRAKRAKDEFFSKKKESLTFDDLYGRRNRLYEENLIVAKPKGKIVKIDLPTLMRESVLRVSVDGRVVLSERVSRREVQHLMNSVILSEAKRKSEDDGEEFPAFPSAFTFTSSVIFISNLKLGDIDEALTNRCIMVPIFLDLDQRLERIDQVRSGMCREKRGAHGQLIGSPQWKLDWANDVAFKTLEDLIEMHKNGQKLWGKNVDIKPDRRPSLRTFSQFVNLWCMLVDRWAGQPLTMETRLSDTIIEQATKSVYNDFLREMFDALTGASEEKHAEEMAEGKAKKGRGK